MRTVLFPLASCSMMTANSVPRTSAVELLGPVTVKELRPTSFLTLFQVLPACWPRLTVKVPSLALSTVLTLSWVPESIRVTEPSGKLSAALVAVPATSLSPSRSLSPLCPATAVVDPGWVTCTPPMKIVRVADECEAEAGLEVKKR